MRGRSFPVATGLLVVLALLGGFRSCFQAAIPPLPANRLLFSPGEYMLQAAHQPVDWRPLSEDSLREARQKAKPILLVIGAPWSETARSLDNQIFSNPETAALINETFVAIRVDGVQQPRWFSSFLPVTRLEMPFDSARTQFLTGFQAYVLDSQGRLLTYIPPGTGAQDLDQNVFADDIAVAKKAFGAAELNGSTQPLTLLQRQDVGQMASSGSEALPNFDNLVQALTATQQNAGDTGFSQEGVPRALPMAWLFQLRTGRRSDLKTSLDPLLLSPWVDVVRGGFFSFRRVAGRSLIDFDQLATTNAEMAALLAEATASTPDPLYDRIAHDTFDMLLRDMREGHLFDACRMGDQHQKSRSASASYPEKRLDEILSGAERNWTAESLGLDVSKNRQMIPYYSSRDVLTDPMLEQVVPKMRAAPVLAPINAGVGCLDVNGHTAAYLLRCARLWGDHDRLNSVLDTVDVIESFRKNADVVHQRAPSSSGPASPPSLGDVYQPYLGDYLAYADEQLEDYLTTGRAVSFANGLAVLERAMDLYYGGEPGLYLLAPKSDDPLMPQDIDGAGLADDVSESCSAQLIRLLTDYGRMLGPSEDGRRLLTAASDTASRFGGLQILNTPRMAGYCVAAAGFEDPQCAFVVGPNAQDVADQLYRLRPGRLVAAAFGPVRPDLRNRKPGVYVANGAIVAGPYTVDQAAALLYPTLQVGVMGD